MIRREEELELRIRPDSGGRYEVRARIGRRETARTFESPFGPADPALVSLSPQDRMMIGQKLFNAVFRDGVWTLLKDVLPGPRSHRSLRLRLYPSPETARWPWELLHGPHGFLADSERVSIVRSLDGTPSEPSPLPRVSWTFRVLMIFPRPRGPEELEGQKELEEIRHGLTWLRKLGLVELERLETATLAALDRRLDLGKPCHGLHFIGHGRAGALLFEDEDGGPDAVEGDRLGAVLGAHGSLRLVVLNACGGPAEEGDAFAGVAQSLFRQRIPAVVTMQAPIPDPVAVAFSRSFYRALWKRRTVDLAVARGRRAMRAVGPGLEWAIPVLFLSSRSGRLFRGWPSKGLWAALLLVLATVAGYGLQRTEVAPLETPPSQVSLLSESCPPVQGVDMKFARFPAGTFTMGSSAGEKDELPLRQVTISRPFCLGVHEVTVKQWEEVMGPNTLGDPALKGDLPVTFITREQVDEYVRKLNGRVGKDIFRLPTEAEWEYAASRGGGGGINCKGDQIDGLAPVDRLRSDASGLLGMLGNAEEMVEDWYAEYPEGPAEDPTGPETGGKRVKRGGSYDSAPLRCRPASRMSYDPTRRDKTLGFRLVRELSEKEAGRVDRRDPGPPGRGVGAMPISLDPAPGKKV